MERHHRWRVAMPGKPNAVVLLSGGVDSATTLAIAKDLGFEVYALTFRYGQRHEAEIAGARRVAAALGAARHETLTFDLRTFGGSALTDDIAVPKGRAPAELTEEIPATYLPARNTIFLAFALAWAETLAARDIFIGATAIDFAGYPDCRPEYIEAFQRMANLATKASVEGRQRLRSEEHTSELQSSQISYAVFCLKKKKKKVETNIAVFVVSSKLRT